MNIYGNNKIANRIRKFLVNHDDTCYIGKTSEGWCIHIREDGQIKFIDPLTGKFMTSSDK